MSETDELLREEHSKYDVKTSRQALTDFAYDPDDALDFEAEEVNVHHFVDDDTDTFIQGLSETTDSYFWNQPREVTHLRGSELESIENLASSKTLQNWIPETGKSVENYQPLDEFLEYIVIDNIQSILEELRSTSGFIAAALVDANSGMTMGSVTEVANFDIEIAAATNTDVVKAKMKAMEALGLDDNIEDILITLGSQYHLIRPLKNEPFIFVYLAVDRQNANLALCRRAMALTEEKLKV